VAISFVFYETILLLPASFFLRRNSSERQDAINEHFWSEKNSLKRRTERTHLGKYFNYVYNPQHSLFSKLSQLASRIASLSNRFHSRLTTHVGFLVRSLIIGSGHNGVSTFNLFRKGYNLDKAHRTLIATRLTDTGWVSIK